jgi:hypothetical protein
MSSTIKTRPVEGSTATLECTFKDTNNNIIESRYISSITWSLYDSENNIVNERENISEDINNLLIIVLTGSDLPYGKLYFYVHVVYDSTVGSNLNLRDEISFYVENLRNKNVS